MLKFICHLLCVVPLQILHTTPLTLTALGRPQRQTYRRANTSLNLGGENSDLFRSCSSILDKFGAKPSRENLAVINGTARVGRSPNSTSFKDLNSSTFKEFLLGRSKERNIFILN